MTIIRKIALAAAPIALMALGGCATGFRADVARFQAMPAPQGETFAVVAQDPALQGGLEFSQYARLVSAELVQQGYQPAASPAQASMIVKLDYGVDRGREKIRSSPGFYGAGYGDPFWGRGGWGGWGGGYGGWGRRGYLMGFHDPFMWGGYGNDVQSYTVYTSDLDMVIERQGNGQRLFEGSAKAVSSTDRLTYLVPNLIEALFTGFPGNSGEAVKITVPPPPKN
ncbi:DUF4136 domain-containing protein [Sphingobium boeckii]|uniref:DUF4136 domain-containing protein n=1 Tax=Sphingobium boeckii TaxID=1082345 RepID=A0A7W9EEZ4_9SPHN|nr:DUF4136 domain-containing protein [Sphingobium boeckii]MBB5685176.1 hypothetical protein [Sphingobium boeckii]